jgi:hypothetical protein
MQPAYLAPEKRGPAFAAPRPFVPALAFSYGACARLLFAGKDE